MGKAVGEAPSNWLSKIIERERERIKRAIPRRERREERDAIVAAIKSHEKGAPLAANPKLAEVVLEALEIAERTDKENEGKPDNSGFPSAAIVAFWHIFDKLALDRPEPEF